MAATGLSTVIVLWLFGLVGRREEIRSELAHKLTTHAGAAAAAASSVVIVASSMSSEELICKTAEVGTATMTARSVMAVVVTVVRAAEELTRETSEAGIVAAAAAAVFPTQQCIQCHTLQGS